MQFMDFGIDPAFNHCIDGLVWVEVSRIKAHKRARYIGSHLGDPGRAQGAGSTAAAERAGSSSPAG